MAMHVSLHINDERGEKLVVSSQYLTDIGETKAEVLSVKFRSGNDSVDLFLDNITDVDNIAFLFETLSRSLREEHGWKEK
jgi:sorbitol-specific phosphotransferase system component IIBC